VPDYDGVEVQVDAAEVSDADIEEELNNLRTRFGTLVTVDRPAKTGDFTQLDLVATINGEEVDTASSISYELGSGQLIEGIDEAIESLTAGESTTFESKLLGGDHEGETAQIAVTVTAVKERELPEADDEFAQIASQFDTIDELKADLREQLAKSKTFAQGSEARDKLVDTLLEKVEIPVPAALVEAEVHRHLENENRLEDDAHRAEVTESSEQAFRRQLLLDAIVEKEQVKVGQDELTQYLVQGASQYGMEPGEFIKVLDQNGQIPGMIGEVARSKALAVALGKVKVVDSNGSPVDLSEFTAAATAPVENPVELPDEDPTGAAYDDHDHEGHSH
jgi:trigger factor